MTTDTRPRPDTSPDPTDVPPPEPRRRPSLGLVVELVVLVVADVVVVRALPDVLDEGSWFVAGAVVLLLVGAHALVIGRRRLVPWRWLGPGLALLVMLTVAPVAYTVYIAFTNYDADHILTRDQAVRSLERETYLPDGSAVFSWTAFRSKGDRLALWLRPQGGGEPVLATTGRVVTDPQPGQDGVGRLDADGVPTSLSGYQRLTRPETVARLTEISRTKFGGGRDVVRVTSLDKAGRFAQRYVYDDSGGTLTDRQTGQRFRPVEGTFTSSGGRELSPSFRVPVGLDNVEQLLGDQDIRGPVAKIFAWTVAFAIIVVAVQFVIGLCIALALQHRSVPRRVAKLVRSVLLLPYVVPAYLSILVWGALLNRNLGVVPLTLEKLVGLDPGWVGGPTGAKVVVLLVAFWLGFPYFMLIISGGLQAVPTELHEAAEIDGAGPLQRFRNVTFPLLLRMVAPLVVLGLAFNFNNFMVVYLLTRGAPAMNGTTTPAGDTDLLISYTYKLAFDFGQNDYALAAVITMFIFVILLPVVVSQFRYYQVWSEAD